MGDLNNLLYRNKFPSRKILRPVFRSFFAVDFRDIKKKLHSFGIENVFDSDIKVNFRVKSFSFDEIDVESDVVDYGGANIKMIKKVNTPFSFTIKFFYEESLFAKRLYFNWLNLMTTNYNLCRTRFYYECDIAIMIYSDETLKNIIEVRKFYNCFPEKIEYDTSFDKDMKDTFEEISIRFCCNGGMKIII